MRTKSKFIKTVIWTIFLISSLQLTCQTPSNEQKAFAVTVTSSTETIKTYVLYNAGTLLPENESVYIWYSAFKIFETKGGFDGRLVHGDFKGFYPNGQLKEFGRVKYGRKVGEWKYWYENGDLREIISWRCGRKNGRYILYSSTGLVLAKGKFKNDKLDGFLKTFDASGKVVSKQKFKGGLELKKREKRTTVKKIRNGLSLKKIPLRKSIAEFRKKLKTKKSEKKNKAKDHATENNQK